MTATRAPYSHHLDWGTAHIDPGKARVAVARHLMHGRSLRFAAAASHVPAATVEAFAQELGWPDEDTVRARARAIVSGEVTAGAPTTTAPPVQRDTAAGPFLDRQQLEKRHARVRAAREALAAAGRSWQDAVRWARSAGVREKDLSAINPLVVDQYLQALAERQQEAECQTPERAPSADTTSSTSTTSEAGAGVTPAATETTGVPALAAGDTRKPEPPEATFREPGQDLNQPPAEPAQRDADRRTRPAHGGREVMDLPIDQVLPDPDNPRGELTDIEDLAGSLRSLGLLQPVVVRPDPRGPVWDGDPGWDQPHGELVPSWLLVMGHRRYAAAQLLGWSTIPAITYPGTSEDVLEAMLVENGQRVQLDPIDEARAIRRLMAKRRLTQQEAATRIGRSEHFVSTRLLLIDQLRADEQDAVRARDLTVGAAVQVARARAGRPAAGDTDRSWHFSLIHPLAERARRLCSGLEHARGRRIAGGVACGKCWERVIREDERVRNAKGRRD